MKSLKIFALVALLSMVAIPFAGAQTGTWDSAFQILNLGTASATVTVTFYAEDGTPTTPDPLSETSNPFTLAPGASATVYLPGVAGLPDGRYSVVISADQPIAAIVNLLGLDGTIYFNGAYGGAEDMGQTEAYLPSIQHDFYGWNDHVSIQNLTGAAMDIDVAIYAGTTTPVYTATMNVAGYASWHLDVGAIGSLGPGFFGSLVASAAGPIAAMDNQTHPDGLTQDYTGFVGGADVMYCPSLLNDYYTWNSSLAVQNIGASSTDVCVNFSDGMRICKTIAANAADFWYQPDEGHSGGWAGSATLTNSASMPLVAIVSQANPVDQAQSYNCYDMGSTDLFAPVTEKRFYGWFTSMQVQNVSASPVDISIVYEGGCTDAATGVAAGASVVFNQLDNVCLPDGFLGGATITANGDIVAIVAQTLADNQTGDMGDWSMEYNTFLR